MKAYRCFIESYTDSFSLITLKCVSDADQHLQSCVLNSVFAENVTDIGQTGIAIYLKDSLEAIYTGNELFLDQIKSMTDGDGSDAAIANRVHQYGLDWL